MKHMNWLTALALPVLFTGCSDPIGGEDAERGPIGKADMVGSCQSSLDPTFTSCGGKSEGNCWCDDECAEYGDCCGDKVSVCDGGLDAVYIDEAGDGETFQVQEGQDVVVLLPSNPSTGYDWQVVATDRTFGYPSSSEYLPDQPEAIGSGGTTQLTWKTAGALSMVGTHSVALEYRRPWESDEEAADSFTFTVEVVPAQGTAVIIDDDDDGATVTAQEGQDVVVQLASNPTTGYEWQVVATDRTFGYPATSESIPDESGALGSGGLQILTWKTDGFLSMVGSHSVTLEYRRPWELDQPALKSFSFTVDIVE